MTCPCIIQSFKEDSLEVHTPLIISEERWNVSIHSNHTTHKLYLFQVFILLFIILFIYISTDWIFHSCEIHLNSVWVHAVFVPFAQYQSVQFHFVLLWLSLSLFLVFGSKAPRLLVQMQFL